MLTIGLTGGIGTGKSEVSRILENLGARVIDADKVGHEAYKPHSPIWEEVIATFGEGILQGNEEIDRKKLGAVVFNDSQEMSKLNAIMHPKMAVIIRRDILQLWEGGAEAVVLEAALLLEAGWDSLVDEIWVTYAPEEAIVSRLQARNNLPEEEIKRRMGLQMPFEEAASHAQVVVNNCEGIEELRNKVKSLWGSRVTGKVR